MHAVAESRRGTAVFLKIAVSEMVMFGAAPIPVKLTDCVPLSRPFVITVNVALRWPVLLALKRMQYGMKPPTGTVSLAAGPETTAKSVEPLKEVEVILSVPGPALRI